MTLPRTFSRGGSPRRQAGLAALALIAVLLMGCASWLATGWLRSQVDARASLVATQADSLRQAARALEFFAANPGARGDSESSGVPAANGYDFCAAAGMDVTVDAGADVHQTIGHDALQASLECASVLASLEALSVGAGWVGPVLDLQASNRKRADAVADVMRMLLTHRTLELDLALLDLGAGVHALLDNQAKLQAAIAATLAGFPPPADAIPTFIAGIASATQALRLNAIDIPRAAVSLALDASTLERYRAAARQALQARPWRGQDHLLVQVRELGLGAGAAHDSGPRPGLDEDPARRLVPHD